MTKHIDFLVFREFKLYNLKLSKNISDYIKYMEDLEGT